MHSGLTDTFVRALAIDPTGSTLYAGASGGGVFNFQFFPGALENPQERSSQSGIGLISDWVCEANQIEIEIDGTAVFEAAYGTSREDTRSECSDADNGFGLLLNWNLIGTGLHEVRALADGVEFGRAMIQVTTLGTEFLTGVAAGSYTLEDFPEAGMNVRVQWQESLQNFVITKLQSSSAVFVPQLPVLSSLLMGVLENPQAGSFQSGIGLISGWVCEATQIDIEIDGTAVFEAAYGTSREDTRSVCGDADNGFGLLFNWNLLGDGTHIIRALADGIEFGSAMFEVSTLGTEFLMGAVGSYPLEDFPEVGMDVAVQWQESLQNFVITE
jgi:hypothetical protein